MPSYFRVTFVLAAVLAVMLFWTAAPGYAQTSNGTIAGTITDKNGAVVSGAKVVATSVDRGGEPRTTETDSVGAFRIESLPPGKYTVSVTASGFAELKFSGVDVKASLTATVSGTLEVAAQTTTVLVEASTGQELQTQSGEISANITQKEIGSLPIFGLNPISLALTMAGVTPPAGRDDFTNGVGFSVNGTRPRANNFLIDGQDNNDNAINGQAFQAINLEAIGEVSILTNSYSAQFGRGGGSVTNVISKGGTNTWHGSAFDIHRNSALAAIPAESKLAGVTDNPVDIENTFGFSLGGPIVKNKWFIFGSPQWDRERSTANGLTRTLPTANGVATLKAVQPTLSANGQANVQYLIDSLGGLVGTQTFTDGTFHTIALGNDASGNPRPAVEIGRVQRSGVSEKSNDRQVYIRTDWNASDKDAVSARYIRDDSSLTPDFFNFAGQLPPYDSQQGGPSETFGASWTHTFNAKVLNEFRASYTNIDFTFGPTPATAANPLSQHALVTIAGSGFPSFGFPSNLPQGRAHRTYQYQDMLSYSFRTHTFRGGVDIAHLSVVDAIPFNSRGTFTYNAGGGYTGLGNYIDDFTGASGSVAKVFGSPILKPFVTTYAPYVEDTWRVRSNLTLTLGMRYEYLGLPENVLQFPAIDGSIGIGLPGLTFPNSFATPQKSDRNNFAPRLGFAWKPRFWSRIFGQDKTVIRGGYGIYYDVLFTNILDNTGAAQPNAVGGTVVGGSGRGTANATNLLASVQPRLNALAGGTTVAGNLVNPLTHQWNFDIQRELPGGWLVTAAYVGTRGVRLFVNQEYNPRVDFGARLNPAFGPLTVRTNGGDSSYHSGQLTVEHKFTKGFLVRGAYTYAKLLDTGSEVFVTSGLSSFAQNPFDQAAERGLSVFNRKHRLALTYLWELPYVHRTNGGWMVMHALTQGWQTAGTISFQTGAPETVTVGFDVNGDGRGGNDRPTLGNPSAPFTSIAIDGSQLGISSPGTFYEINNAFNCDDVTVICNPVDPNNFRWLIRDSGLGNVGRNTIVTAGFQNWNLSIQRTFKLYERHALMLRAEFFNAFNHPNQGIPDLTLLDFDSGFGDFQLTRFGGRQIKIWLRYSF
jgi:outer membrane receptor protein involved in Fe transport